MSWDCDMRLFKPVSMTVYYSGRNLEISNSVRLVVSLDTRLVLKDQRQKYRKKYYATFHWCRYYYACCITRKLVGHEMA